MGVSRKQHDRVVASARAFIITECLEANEIVPDEKIWSAYEAYHNDPETVTGGVYLNKAAFLKLRSSMINKLKETLKNAERQKAAG